MKRLADIIDEELERRQAEIEAKAQLVALEEINRITPEKEGYYWEKELQEDREEALATIEYGHNLLGFSWGGWETAFRTYSFERMSRAEKKFEQELYGGVKNKIGLLSKAMSQFYFPNHENKRLSCSLIQPLKIMEAIRMHKQEQWDGERSVKTDIQYLIGLEGLLITGTAIVAGFQFSSMIVGLSTYCVLGLGLDALFTTTMEIDEIKRKEKTERFTKEKEHIRNEYNEIQKECYEKYKQLTSTKPQLQLAASD